MNAMDLPALILPGNRDLYYGGRWMKPADGETRETVNPATGKSLGPVAYGRPHDMAAAIEAAHAAFPAWRDTPPLERAKLLREMADVMRAHKAEFALLDAADCGNPVSAMMKDIDIAAGQLDFFAGLVTEMKGDSIPMGPDAVNFTVREPLGVVGRIIAFNHPVMFCAGKIAAPLAAGNTVVLKPAEQAPLSALRFAELTQHILPAGVFNVVHGGADAGAVLAGHPKVAMIGLIGSVPTGRAVMGEAARTVKPVMLELGGKNALVACPDADLDKTAAGIIAGMNFAWCGQSCGSTSRAFLHADVHDALIKRVLERVQAFRPGDPTRPETTMGALISRQHQEKVLRYIEAGKNEGARLLCGGGAPDDPALANGYFVEPTIFSEVQPHMTVACEEIFGPVLAILRWSDESELIQQVNAVEYGLTCSIWTRDLARAHRLAHRAEAGYVWINKAGPHFPGTPFGGVKQSGIGREECLGELISFTQEKNIYIALD